MFYAFFLAVVLGMIDKDTWQVIGLSLVCVNLILSYDFLKYIYIHKIGKKNLCDNELLLKFNLINLKLYLNSYVFLAYLLVLIINFLDKRCYVTSLTTFIFGNNNLILIAYTKGTLFLISFLIILIVIFLLKNNNIKAIKSFRCKMKKTYIKLICIIINMVFQTDSKTIFENKDEAKLECSTTINNE